MSEEKNEKALVNSVQIASSDRTYGKEGSDIEKGELDECPSFSRFERVPYGWLTLSGGCRASVSSPPKPPASESCVRACAWYMYE